MRCIDCQSPDVSPPAQVCFQCQLGRLASSIMLYTGRVIKVLPKTSCFCDNPRLPECVSCTRPLAHAAVIELFSLKQGALL